MRTLLFTVFIAFSVSPADSQEPSVDEMAIRPPDPVPEADDPELRRLLHSGDLNSLDLSRSENVVLGVIDKHSDLPEVEMSLKVFLGFTLLYRGRVLDAREDSAAVAEIATRARDYYLSAREVLPTDQDGGLWAAQISFGLGQRYDILGSSEEALEEYRHQVSTFRDVGQGEMRNELPMRALTKVAMLVNETDDTEQQEGLVRYLKAIAASVEEPEGVRIVARLEMAKQLCQLRRHSEAQDVVDELREKYGKRDRVAYLSIPAALRQGRGWARDPEGGRNC